MKKFLHVSIVWRSTPKLPDQLKPIFNLADDWVTYGNGNWIIYTGEDASVWQGRVIAMLDVSQDGCFISEISDVHDTSGWLPAWVWQWLRKPRIDDSPYGSLLLPISR